jgi:predicted CDP-diglyceride synthetase/phosphatidate cytidylyltransferase
MDLDNKMPLLTKQQITIANWINNLDSYNNRAREILWLVKKVVQESQDIENYGFDELFNEKTDVINGCTTYNIKEVS